MLNAGCGLLAPLKDQVEAKAVQETSILYKLTMKSSHRSLQTVQAKTHLPRILSLARHAILPPS